MIISISNTSLIDILYKSIDLIKGVRCHHDLLGIENELEQLNHRLPEIQMVAGLNRWQLDLRDTQMPKVPFSNDYRTNLNSIN